MGWPLLARVAQAGQPGNQWPASLEAGPWLGKGGHGWPQCLTQARHQWPALGVADTFVGAGKLSGPVRQARNQWPGSLEAGLWLGRGWPLLARVPQAGQPENQWPASLEAGLWLGMGWPLLARVAQAGQPE